MDDYTHPDTPSSFSISARHISLYGIKTATHFETKQ